jgi:hypothetical protein
LTLQIDSTETAARPGQAIDDVSWRRRENFIGKQNS